jgi:acetate kinase
VGSNVLVVNAGSTGLKLSLVSPHDETRRLGAIEDAQTEDVEAVGHRIVHGGERFLKPVFVDDATVTDLAALSALAPLHNAPAVEALERARIALPGVPHVAVFDTAFHATMPDEATVYAVPWEWRERWGIRRYGFHGISVQWCAEQLGVGFRRVIVCHLGGGSSVTAVLDGRSVDTTMGFSPLEGVPMDTRSGSVDPGVLLYLLQEQAMTPAELDQALNHESGLRALSSLTGSMREIEEAAAHDVRARLALDVYTHRVAGAVAAMAAALGGVDALVFTGGIGEGSAGTRERVCARLGFLDAELDPRANAAAEPDADVAASSSPARIWVIHTREDLVIARAVRQLMAR